jgi:hypothetical protein
MRRIDRNLVGYCGLDCTACFIYRRTVSDAAKSLRRELRAAKLKTFWKGIPFLGEYEPFKKSLDGLAALVCTKGCRPGGGNPWCKVRLCVRKRGHTGCWECADLETCTKFSEASRSRLKKIRRLGLQAVFARESG